jgi:predicted TIM-barrel fold metal-dependent hydrolase
MTDGKSNGELVIDADGHIIEPPDLWERYLEPKYRERAIRIKVGSDGWEYLEVDGRPAQCTTKGTLGRLSSMGRNVQEMKQRRDEWIKGGRQGPPPFIKATPDETYVKGAGFGTMDPKQRLKKMDEEGLAKSVLFPTLGLNWEAETKDADYANACCRAYNRWIADFCRDSGGRLVPAAHISLGDPTAAAHELQRAVKDGCKIAFISPYTITRKPHGHPDHDVVFATAQDLGVPLAVHPNFEPREFTIHTRFEPMRGGASIWYSDMFTNQGSIMAFATMFVFGVWDKFPRLRFVILESGAGWIGWWLNRADAMYKETLLGGALPLAECPSYYFNRQCFISGDPDETVLRHIIDYVGADKFFWASDFPHADHPVNYMEEIHELVEKMSPQGRRGILGENVAQALGI